MPSVGVPVRGSFASLPVLIRGHEVTTAVADPPRAVIKRCRHCRFPIVTSLEYSVAYFHDLVALLARSPRLWRTMKHYKWRYERCGPHKVAPVCMPCVDMRRAFAIAARKRTGMGHLANARVEAQRRMERADRVCERMLNEQFEATIMYWTLMLDALE